jgi:NAD(P)-dependent dehydrogenase (short-subunit alcohol dehydrogenase family)
MIDSGRLASRRALVIGAGTPAGRVIAIALATAGSAVAVASATTDGEDVMAARRTRRAVEALGQRAAEYAFDITLGQNVQVSTRQVAKELGGLDILVTAHGYPLRQPIERTSDSEWTRTLALNLGGVFFACRAAVREMTNAGGVIINVISALDATALSGAAAQAAAVYGVCGLTRALALECAGRSIRVYAVSPISSASPDPLPMLRPAEISAEDDIGALCVTLAGDTDGRASGRLIGVSAPG